MADDKQEIASQLIQDFEECKRFAKLEMDELKNVGARGTVPMTILQFINTIKTNLDNIKALFMGKTS